MQKFQVPFKDTELIGDIMGDRTPPVLFLHGAGTSDRSRFSSFRELLNQEGISSCAFDFIGHGETGGNLHSSSLKERTDQALEVIQKISLEQPLSIIAASMSGYTAIKLAELVQVRNIFFLAPGLYTPKAYTVSFGDEFSAIIRQADSWKETDAWDILQRFTENIVIFVAEKDQVVPKELTDRMYNSAVSAASRKLVIIKDATHPLGKYLEEHPADLERVVDDVTEILKN